MYDEQMKDYVDKIVEVGHDWGLTSFRAYGGDGYSGRGMYGRSTPIAFVASTSRGIGEIFMAIGLGVAEGVLPEDALTWINSQDNLGLEYVVYGHFK